MEHLLLEPKGHISLRESIDFNVSKYVEASTYHRLIGKGRFIEVTV
ncbi:MAG: hypothetical protein N2745_01655 [Syntrophorhabdaceae bacterium]|nr:hypothetical protein [Syntrophorhabdaceae bacterium]